MSPHIKRATFKPTVNYARSTEPVATVALKNIAVLSSAVLEDCIGIFMKALIHSLLISVDFGSAPKSYYFPIF